MPKVFNPALLANCDTTREFCLQKQITDVDSLRSHLQNSVCLGVDIEGCEGIGEGVTSIGFVFLPPFTDLPLEDLRSKVFPRLPFETHGVVSRCEIVAYCVYLEYRRLKKPHPAFLYGHTIRTTKENIGQEIQAIIDGVKQRFNNKDIVLVDWHPHPRELPGLEALAPDIFCELAGWVDVTDVTRQICVSKQEDLNKRWPSLGDVLLSVGLSATCQPQRYHHSAGNDAIHTVGLLVRLLTHSGAHLEVRGQRLLKQWEEQDFAILTKHC